MSIRPPGRTVVSPQHLNPNITFGGTCFVHTDINTSSEEDVVWEKSACLVLQSNSSKPPCICIANKLTWGKQQRLSWGGHKHSLDEWMSAVGNAVGMLQSKMA